MPTAAGITASIPSPDPAWSQVSLGPFTLHAYALCLLAGIVLATYITHRRLVARGADREVTLDIVFWAVPLGIVVARIYHVLTHLGDYADGTGTWGYWEWVRVWDGGIAIYGALIGGALGVWIGCRRAGLRFWSFADALAPAMLAAQAVGRLGNYLNQELYGAPTTLPWGLEISPGVIDDLNKATGTSFVEGTLFHPTFLYEMLWNLAAAAFLIWLDRRYRLGHGRVFWAYVAVYTLGRVWIEMLRIDTAEHVLGLRLNVWTSIIVGLGAIVAFVVIGRLRPGREDGVWLPGRAPSGAEAVDAQESNEHDNSEHDGAADSGADRADLPAGGDGPDRADVDAGGPDKGPSAHS